MKELNKLKSVNENAIMEINKKIDEIDAYLEILNTKFNDEKSKKFEKIVLYKQMENVSKSMENENTEKFKLIEEDLSAETKEIKKEFDDNIKDICENIKTRISNWNVKDVTNVSFNSNSYDFLFDNKPIKIQPKGLKSICTLATNLEIILFMKNNGIVVPSFLTIDSLWVGSDFKYISKKELKQSIINDVNKSGLQIAIFENEDDDEKLTNCNYLSLS